MPSESSNTLNANAPSANTPALDPGNADSRVLLLPPTARDAQAIAKVLAGAGISSVTCLSIHALCDQLSRGAGAVVIAEEILTADPFQLLACIQAQPVWSDPPIIVLSRAGIEPPKLTNIIPQLRNIAVLERPVRMNTMLSLVQSTLRARQRQYQIRDHLAMLARADENLRTSEERVRLAVQTGKLGVWELNLQNNDLHCSDQCKAHFGRRPADAFTHTDLWASIHPDDVQRVRQAIRRTIADGTEFDTVHRCLWPDGSLHWILARGSRQFTPGTTRRRMIGVTLDMTERKTAEEERLALLDSERTARADAERASRMKDEFLATLSHELRTPLNAILGWTQILAMGPQSDDDLAEGLRTIERNARAQTQIIEDLLDMSKIISGKVRLNLQHVILSSVVQAAVETLRPTADAKGVLLLVTLDPSTTPISGDPNRLQQVFWNLLTNAIKFTPHGARVQVTLHRTPAHLEVSVIDAGEGIAPEFLPFVFDRFRQADASTTRRHGGLGLGLAIVKQLVELHGGTVRATSPGRGHGATFVVSLPATSVQEIAGSGDRRHPAPDDARIPLADTTDDIAGARILILDDEPDSRDLVKRLLADRKALPFTAATAAEALELLKSARPAVIVSDIGMPGEDGYAFIRKVRALPPDQGGDTPAIALTAYARAEDRVHAARAGFQQHLAKPVEPAELIAVIASLLRQ